MKLLMRKKASGVRAGTSLLCLVWMSAIVLSMCDSGELLQVDQVAPC